MVAVAPETPPMTLLGRLLSALSPRRPEPSAPVDADDEAEDARLLRLAERITPRREELREIRAKLPPSSISYDDEGEMPY